jgi:hypothetical protein
VAENETKEPVPSSGNNSVQLGVGTLIIVALIVTMCSGRGEIEKVQKDTAELKQQLKVINSKLDALAPNGDTTAPTDIEAPAVPVGAAPAK